VCIEFVDFVRDGHSKNTGGTTRAANVIRSQHLVGPVYTRDVRRFYIRRANIIRRIVAVDQRCFALFVRWFFFSFRKTRSACAHVRPAHWGRAEWAKNTRRPYDFGRTPRELVSVRRGQISRRPTTKPLKSRKPRRLYDTCACVVRPTRSVSPSHVTVWQSEGLVAKYRRAT